MNGIELNDISKSYKDIQALSHINLHFEENTIYGLLGRNGAGKSTLLNIINNRVLADNGTVTLNGQTVTENSDALCRFFLINEENYYPEGLKVKDAFKWSREFFPSFDRDYAEKLCNLFELSPKKKIKRLSTGYQAIFKNIVALSVNVPYVFFDEPVLGLDACHRDLFYKLLIEKYAENPFTIIISTHLIEEVANIIENVIIINNGKIIKNETRDELLKAGYCVSGISSLVDSYITGKQVIGTEILGGLKTAYILGKPEAGIPDSLSISGMDLQKLFIQLTNTREEYKL